MQFDALVETLQSGKKRVVLYGMHHVAELVILGMAMKGIHPVVGYDISPAIFLKGTLHGVPIESADKIFNEPKDAYIFLVITYDFNKMRSALYEAGYENVYDAIDFMALVDIDRFGVEYYRNEFEAYGAPRIQDISAVQLHEPSSLYKREYDRHRAIMNQNREGVFRYIRSLAIVLGTRCTLRCRDCCAEVQYYDGKENYSLETIKASLDKILGMVDCIGIVVLSGSEPFMYKHMMDVVRLLHSYKKISLISISTNGSVIPEDDVFRELNAYGVRIDISDYGDKVKNRDAFYKKASRYMRFIFENKDDVPYFENGVWVKKDKAWADPGSFGDKGHTTADIAKRCYHCSMRKALVLYGDKLYNCWRSAACMRLNILPEVEGEVLTVSNSSLSEEEFRRQLANIADFTRNSAPLRACARCNGLSNFDQPVAEQVDHQMDPYEKDGISSE